MSFPIQGLLERPCPWQPVYLDDEGIYTDAVGENFKNGRASPWNGACRTGGCCCIQRAARTDPLSGKLEKQERMNLWRH